MSVRLVPAIRDLFSERPLAVRCTPEKIAAMLRAGNYAPGDGRPDCHEVEAALEALDIEREAA